MRTILVGLFQRGALGLTCLIVTASGVLGFIDGQWIGGIGNLVVATVFLAPVYYMAFLVGAYIQGPTTSESAQPRSDQHDSDVAQSPIARSAADLVLGFGLLIVCGLVIGVGEHEAHHLGNIVVLTLNHNANVTMMNSTARGDSREYLRDSLKGHEWPLTVAHSRPARWLLSPEVEEINESNLRMIEFLQGKGMERGDNSPRLTEQATSELVTELWRSDNWLARKVTDKSLNLYGLAISEACKSRIEDQRSQGWLLRFVPTDFFQQ
ncbi:MAG: hypothetical protein KDA83_13540 [Planctomycetales bacterium]|nr:hypothetical protein [Planctomycetales bacterium]